MRLDGRASNEHESDLVVHEHREERFPVGVER
jgi:hypothetical protein